MYVYLIIINNVYEFRGDHLLELTIIFGNSLDVPEIGNCLIKVMLTLES